MSDKYREQQEEGRERFHRIAWLLGRGVGQGRHAAGKVPGSKRKLLSMRKRQRRARRYARLCSQGRKHQFRGTRP